MTNNIAVSGNLCEMGVEKLFQKKTGCQIVLKISGVIANAFC
jgi:hypothetical protein